MTYQSGDSFELWITPDVDLVLGVPMCTHYLMHISAECQVAYLRSCILFTDDLACQDVSQTKHAVGGSSARRQQPVLLRRPGQGFNCCSMVSVLAD